MVEMERRQHEQEAEYFCAAHHACDGITVHRQCGEKRSGSSARSGRLWYQLSKKEEQEDGDAGMKHNVDQMKAEWLEPVEVVIHAESEYGERPV